jgi:hypothetical protein
MSAEETMINELLVKEIFIDPAYIDAAKHFAESNPWKGTISERKMKFEMFHDSLCLIAKKDIILTFQNITGKKKKKIKAKTKKVTVRNGVPDNIVGMSEDEINQLDERSRRYLNSISENFNRIAPGTKINLGSRDAPSRSNAEVRPLGLKPSGSEHSVYVSRENNVGEILLYNKLSVITYLALFGRAIGYKLNNDDHAFAVKIFQESFPSQFDSLDYHKGKFVSKKPAP